MQGAAASNSASLCTFRDSMSLHPPPASLTLFHPGQDGRGVEASVLLTELAACSMCAPWVSLTGAVAATRSQGSRAAVPAMEPPVQGDAVGHPATLLLLSCN